MVWIRRIAMPVPELCGSINDENVQVAELLGAGRCDLLVPAIRWWQANGCGQAIRNWNPQMH
ncbi:hypothetical protein GGTG_00429 [Gaeumannomyces tritici R3-111a-1]|uniref:Uncharacterized protein n=1 Tax=Gaeumannomyces tritici (strain R3-111a-1) TaxID=644352 RepID=J3NGP0_GAET3|nr:hypothetical protein GGTG_00429 [Gaeumannomyces tritici R3-111a-1]EJT80430.1 hypothetical protein GGTG_00429 [Gaeumannomyces tritici R3-111a-1]